MIPLIAARRSTASSAQQRISVSSADPAARASPDSIRKFLDLQGEVPYGGDARPISASSYEAEADRMRDERAIVKVLCRVGDR